MSRPAAVALVLASAIACDDPARPVGTPRSVAVALSAPSAIVGQALAASPTFTVVDDAGRPLGGLPVTIAVVEGAGTLIAPPTRTAAGPTPVGQWVLGRRSGRNALEVRVNGLAPVTIVATGVPGQATQILGISGNRRRAPAGTEMAEPLVLQVADEFGNGIGGAAVSLTVEQGATLSATRVTTDAGGLTPPVTWRLGVKKRAMVGRAELVANPAVSTTLRADFASDYDIVLRFASPPPPVMLQAFESAADRIAGVLVGDVADQPLMAFDPTRCGGPAGPVTETVDDVVIYAAILDIDGPGKVLGRAGPCLTRSTSRFTIVGTMQFDLADAQNLVNSGRFEAVVMHEMLHVIGIGSLWQSRNLVEGIGTPDPRFMGARAATACAQLGFGSACGGGTVPVENIGGSGTAGSHWRESVFDAELMTGFAEATPAMPLSAMTIGALEDFGYAMNLVAADAFAPPPAARLGPWATARPGDDPFDQVLKPIGEVLPTGWVRPWR